MKERTIRYAEEWTEVLGPAGFVLVRSVTYVENFLGCVKVHMCDTLSRNTCGMSKKVSSS